jgi:hypothetical protein
MDVFGMATKDADNSGFLKLGFHFGKQKLKKTEKGMSLSKGS